MRVLFLVNRDIESNIALNFIFQTYRPETAQILISDHVGGNQVLPPILKTLAYLEQDLPNKIVFPLLEKTPKPRDRFLTFAEMEAAYGFPVKSLTKINRPSGRDAVRSFAPDVIVSIRYGAILKSRVIAIPSKGVINLHSGLLPQYRGVMATFRALSNGDSHIGCTLHYIEDAGIDTGSVISRSRIPVQADKSYFLNVIALYESGSRQIVAALKLLERQDRLETSVQIGEGAYYSFPTVEEIEALRARGVPLFEWGDLEEVLHRYFALG